METPPVSIGSKKTVTGSLTKSTLTPCRRPGLSRPSSNHASLNKSCRTNAFCTPGADVINKFKDSEDSEPSTPKLNSDKIHNVPLQLSDVQNKHSNVPKVRRRLAVVSKTPEIVKGTNRDSLKSLSVKDDNSPACKKSKLSLELQDCQKEVVECRVSLDNLPNIVPKSVIPFKTIEDEDNLNEEVTPEAIEKLVKSIHEKKKKLEQLKVQEVYAKKHNLEELRAQIAKWKKAGQEALVYSVDLAKHAGYSVTTSQLMNQHGFPRHLMGYNSEDDEFE